MKTSIIVDVHCQTPTATAFWLILPVSRIIVSTEAGSHHYLAILNNVHGVVNTLVDPDSFNSLLTRAAEMVERHSVLFWIYSALKPILEPQVRAPIGIAFKYAKLDSSAEIEQNFGDSISPPVIGNVIGNSVIHQ